MYFLIKWKYYHNQFSATPLLFANCISLSFGSGAPRVGRTHACNSFYVLLSCWTFILFPLLSLYTSALVFSLADPQHFWKALVKFKANQHHPDGHEAEKGSIWQSAAKQRDLDNKTATHQSQQAWTSSVHANTSTKKSSNKYFSKVQNLSFHWKKELLS